REELLQKTVRDITHPDDLAASIDAATALWQGESPILRLEKRYVRKDGSLVWGELFASLQRDAAGKPAYDISIVNDISEGKRLEEELRASEERQRLILDNAHDAFVAMSADGLITEWNHQAEITFGWPRGEAVGRVLAETIIPPQFREAHQRGLARFLATGEGPLLNRVLEGPALRRDGREFPAEIRIAPVRVGEQYLFAAFIRDVTERKRAEEEIGRLNQELRSRVDEMQAILDVVPVGIGIALDPECRRITHNPYLSEVLGVPVWRNASLTAPADERPDNFRVFWGGQEVPPDQLPMQLACTGVEVRDFELDIVRTDGGPTCKLLCYVRPLKDAEGRIRGSVGGFLDITARRKAEEELRRAEEAAGGGQPGQGRVFGQRQPRDPHAHERHPRHDRPGPRHPPDRGPAAVPDDGQVGGGRPPRGHQRHPGLRQDPGRPPGTGPGPLLALADAGRHPARAGRARPQEGAGTGMPTAARRARCADRRRRPAPPGAHQPRGQRHQVHRTRRGRGACGKRR